MAYLLDDYRLHGGVRRRRSLDRSLAAVGDVLFVGQFIRLVPWALFERSIFEDGAAEKPLPDFFVEIGPTLQTVGLVLVGGFRCRIEVRETRSFRDRFGLTITSALGLAFVGLAAAGWVVDDVINVNVTH